MYRRLLPIGSVVLLSGGRKRVMICGRLLTREGEDTIYDYVGCYYPEGIVDPKAMSFFHHEMISRVYFMGFQDAEELKFHEMVLDKLEKLEVKDGKIVPCVEK